MARWRLRNGHYINILTDGKPAEWEYKEVDRSTGKAGRKIFYVPTLLDPNDSADRNYPDDIIVCHEGKGLPRDYIFTGEPTPDMEPLDEEAEKISEGLRDKWEHPIESLPSTMNDGESAFMKKMMDAFGGGQPTSVPIAQFDELKKLVEDLQAQLATTKPASMIKPAVKV